MKYRIVPANDWSDTRAATARGVQADIEGLQWAIDALADLVLDEQSIVDWTILTVEGEAPVPASAVLDCTAMHMPTWDRVKLGEERVLLRQDRPVLVLNGCRFRRYRGLR